MQWNEIKVDVIEAIETNAEVIASRAYALSRLAKLLNRTGYVIMLKHSPLAVRVDRTGQGYSYVNLWEVTPYEQHINASFAAANLSVSFQERQTIMPMREAVQQALRETVRQLQEHVAIAGEARNVGQG